MAINKILLQCKTFLLPRIKITHKRNDLHSFFYVILTHNDTFCNLNIICTESTRKDLFLWITEKKTFVNFKKKFSREYISARSCHKTSCQTYLEYFFVSRGFLRCKYRNVSYNFCNVMIDEQLYERYTIVVIF